MLVQFKDVSKTTGAELLFQALSLNLSSDTRLGIVGRNGSGKSTLLKLISGEEEVDAGGIWRARGLRISVLPQQPVFEPGLSPRQVVLNKAKKTLSDEREIEARVEQALGRSGFAELGHSTEQLSGGWKKRLALAAALSQAPDLLLLDEPTNHLDLEGIWLLEEVLKQSSFAWALVSHDRAFLQSCAKNILELDSFHPNGWRLFSCGFLAYKEKRRDLEESLERQTLSTAVQVRRETKWLHTSPKARSTKARARIEQAEALQDELSELARRARTNKTELSFSSSGRQTKRLLTAKNLSKSFPGKTILSKADFLLSPGMRWGVLGKNGSGKNDLFKASSWRDTSRCRHDYTCPSSSYRILLPAKGRA